MSAPPTVSFIVPTRDASRVLEPCLQSLRSQDHMIASTEIIVVDNGSTDNTRVIANQLADVVTEFGPERSAQRNHGAARARGEILVFVDADMVLEPSIADECAHLLAESPTLGGLVLPELSTGQGFFARCRALEKRLYVGDERVEAARAFRRRAFESVGGFDESMNAFEDWDLPDRVSSEGWRIGRTTGRVWHDDGRVSPRRQFAKKRYYGEQSGQYLVRENAPRRRRLLRTGALTHPGLLFERPHVTAGLAWLKACEGVGLALGARAAIRRSTHRSPEPGAPGAIGRPRVMHVVGEFDGREGTARSIIELATTTPGEHHLLSTRIGAGAEVFASAQAVGGSMGTFPFTRPGAVRRVTARVDPDIVHFHGGPLLSLWAPLRIWRAPTAVASIYGWARVPPIRDLRRVDLRALLASQVVRPRVFAASALHGAMVARLLRRGRVRTVLTTDDNTVQQLGGHGIDVRLVAGATRPDDRRARLDQHRPVVVFAGRAESVRGIDTLLDSVPALRERHPEITVRLVLLERSELERIRRRVSDEDLDGNVELSCDPLPDLRVAFAGASVGVFPFMFDYVTSPPPLSVTEAMSVGLPVVGTDVACLAAVLREQVNGLTVPVDDPGALAGAISDVLEDACLWERLAAGGIATVAHGLGRPSIGSSATASYGLTAAATGTPCRA